MVKFIGILIESKQELLEIVREGFIGYNFSVQVISFSSHGSGLNLGQHPVSFVSFCVFIISYIPRQAFQNTIFIYYSLIDKPELLIG